MRDYKFFLEALKPILEDFGYTDANTDLIWSPQGHKLLINTSIAIPNNIASIDSREGLGAVIKALKDRLSNSNYLDDITSDYQDKVETLEKEVDNLKSLLHNALELRKLAKIDDDGLSVL